MLTRADHIYSGTTHRGHYFELEHHQDDDGGDRYVLIYDGREIETRVFAELPEPVLLSQDRMTERPMHE